jgi:ABC-type cobalamin transport system permease subunit
MKLKILSAALLASLGASSAAIAEELSLSGVMVTKNTRCYLKTESRGLLELNVINDAYLRPYLEKTVIVDGDLESGEIDVDRVTLAQGEVIYDWDELDSALYN